RYSVTTSVGSPSPASGATGGAKTRYSRVPPLASPRRSPRVAVSLPPSSPGTSVRSAIPTIGRSYAEHPPAACAQHRVGADRRPSYAQLQGGGTSAGRTKGKGPPHDGSAHE